MTSPNLLVVCGPTASGKTALAVTLAAQCNGEVISADSRQVYRRLDIGSGKDLHEYSVPPQKVPYHLIDIVDPTQVYSLYHFQQDFHRVFRSIRERGVLPVLCGGSGLYIESVLRGFRIPAVPENNLLRTELMKKPKDELSKQLKMLSQERYLQTDLNSKKRIIRSLEVAMASKTRQCPKQPPSPNILHPVVLCTRWNRTILRERISHRLTQRLNKGMLEEVQRLRTEGIADQRLLMLGMEYKYLTLHLRGEMNLQEMTRQLQLAIFRLAKRQDTYFRGMERRCNLPFHWIDNADGAVARSIAERHFSC